MMVPALKRIRGKVARARALTEDLRLATDHFFGANSYSVVSELNPTRTEEIWRFKLADRDTTELSLRAGEILHSLRTPLDNIVCEVATAHGGTSKDTYFPFGKSEQVFKAEAKRKTKRLPQSAVQLIASFRPYRGGDDLLWSLHDLDREDKHPGLDIMQVNQGMMMGELLVYSGTALMMGSRYGTHMTVAGYTPSFLPIVVSDDVEFLTTTPGAKFTTNARPAFGVALQCLGSGRGEPATETLIRMAALVDGILDSFEQQFFP